jgi:trehalose-6-phosphate synthase
MSPQERQEAYFQYWNGVVWPVMHGMLDKIIDCPLQCVKTAETINEKFAELVSTRAGKNDVVFVHDYHFLEMPEKLRERRPDLGIVYFHHIPFPAPEVLRQFEALPNAGGREVLKSVVSGLLGADLVGFHTAEYASNFLSACEQCGYVVDRDRSRVIVVQDGKFRFVSVGDFPISVNVDSIRAEVACPTATEGFDKVVQDAGWKPGMKLSVRIERADYTKAIPVGFEAIGTMLREQPDLKEKFVHIQIAAPTRVALAPYAEHHQLILDTAQRINAEHGTDTWKPIKLIDQPVPHAVCMMLHRNADVSWAAPIKDGFNLTPPEAAATGSKAWLLVSRGAGASHVFGPNGAGVIEEHSAEAIGRALGSALSAGPERDAERLAQAKAYQNFIDSYTATDWIESMLSSTRIAVLNRNAIQKDVPVNSFSLRPKSA